VDTVRNLCSNLCAIVLLVGCAYAHPSALLFQHGFIEAPPASPYRYHARSGALHLYCRSSGISLVAAHVADTLVRAHRVDLDFATWQPTITAHQQRSEQYHFTNATARYDLRAFEVVRYENVAPGVDVFLRWNPTQVKYDVVVHPGGQLDQFRFTVRGGRIERTRGGALRIRCGTEEFLDAPPVAFQESPDGTRVPVMVEYAILSDTVFGYRIYGAFDARREVVIDPAIVWSTYLGGSQEDAANDIATDGAGTIYVAGNTRSIDFPLRGATFNRGRQNMVIAKFTANGQHLWSTYFGGEQDEVAKAIVVDPRSGMLYVGGWSSSPSVILDQPYPNRAGGAFDAVVLAFSSTDGTFVRGTFLGGSREELINALAVRQDGSLIAVGRSNSNDFPVAQAQQATLAGDNDITITALSLPTLQVLWSTYYGGSAFDEAYGVAVSPSGSVFVTGVTVSADFPTANAYQGRPPMLDNAFVLALNSSGRRTWATYLGGNDYDLGNRLVYWNGLLFVAGTTSSADFPIQGDSIAQRSKSGFNDAFLTCMSESGTLQWSTYWGGQLAESGFGVAALSDGQILLAGSTSSPDFPRRRSILTTARGGDDIFVALFRDGSNRWSATFGGSADDILYAVAVLPSGDIVGTGETHSRDVEPLVAPQYTPSTSPSNRTDCFLFRLCTFTPSIVASSPRRVLCNGESLELWASDSAAMATILWSTGDTQHRITVRTAGEYWFTAISNSGCTVSSDTVRIAIVNNEPVLLDTIAPRRTLQLCEGERVGFTLRGRYRSHAWFDERGELITTDDTLWVTTAGRYHTIVEDTNGCVLQSAPQRVEVIGRPALRYLHRIGAQLLPVPSDTITACMGTAIAVDIERPAAAQCLWSDGVTTCQRVFTAPARVNAAVTDSLGCRWVMSDLVVRFEERITPTLQAPDTVCMGTAFTARSSGQARWEVSTGMRITNADPDSATVTLVASASGTYRLRTWIGNACSDTLQQLVTIVAPPRIRIRPSQLWLCPGQQAILTAPSGFVSYRWNQALGDSVLIVSDSGWYQLEVRDRFGCIAADSIYLGRRQPLTTTTVTVDFGTLQVGQSSSQSIALVNSADTAASTALVFRAGTAFTAQPSSAEIPPSQTLDVVITFRPSSEGQFQDTLIIVQMTPCAETLRIVVTGRATRSNPQPISVTFDIEDVDVSPLDQQVLIPLYAWSASASRIDTLWLDLSYNPTMLMPVDIVPGRIEPFPPIGDRAVVRVAIPLDTLPPQPRTVAIAILRATVLLGDREEDSILLERATAKQPLLYEPADGRVRYTNLCRIGGVRLLGRSTPTVLLHVAPNPADGDAIALATAVDNGPACLELFASNGQMVWQLQFAAKAGTTYAAPLPLVGAGTYFLRFRTASGWTTWTPLIVLR